TCSNAGACGVNNTQSGFVVQSQMAGDCHVNQCDGSGGVTSVVDDSDAPVDGNQCTLDMCMNGVPSNPPQMAGVMCNQNNGRVCDGAKSCVACNLGADCPGM